MVREKGPRKRSGGPAVPTSGGREETVLGDCDASSSPSFIPLCLVFKARTTGGVGAAPLARLLPGVSRPVAHVGSAADSGPRRPPDRASEEATGDRRRWARDHRAGREGPEAQRPRVGPCSQGAGGRPLLFNYC